jgi:hypothetical protein
MTEPRVEIYDIMACNVYMDFENSLLQKEQHKFLVAFYPTGAAPVPELIESITAYGPNGYQVPIANQEFTASNRNGWIYDRTTHSHWYMVNLDTGFMQEGNYTIEVKTKDGRVLSRSRRQNNGSSAQLVLTYRKLKEQLAASYAPGKARGFEAGMPLTQLPVTWKSLKELADLDSYSIFRLSEGRSGKEFNTQKLVWWDNIFVQRLGEPKAGLNRDRVVLGSELKPDTAYVYFVETTDSNAMGSTNICIFQPHQTFHT